MKNKPKSNSSPETVTSGKWISKRARDMHGPNAIYTWCRLGSANQFAKHVARRYTSYFGPPNQQLHFANHSLVLLDAPGLVNEDYQRAGRGTSFDDWRPLKGGAIEFVKNIAIREFCSIGSPYIVLMPIKYSGRSEPSIDPTILFTHIPLHRSESRYCGPLRERGGYIHRGVGKGWQSMLGKQTSAFLLETLKPVAVFRCV